LVAATVLSDFGCRELVDSPRARAPDSLGAVGGGRRAERAALLDAIGQLRLPTPQRAMTGLRGIQPGQAKEPYARPPAAQREARKRNYMQPGG